MTPSAERWERMAQRRREAGRCIRCDDPNDRAETEHDVCSGCADVRSLKESTAYEERAAAGICVKCRKAAAEPGRKQCQRCSQGHADHVKAKREQWKREGLCAQCGKRSPRERVTTSGEIVRLTKCEVCADRCKAKPRADAPRSSTAPVIGSSTPEDPVSSKVEDSWTNNTKSRRRRGTRRTRCHRGRPRC